MSFYYGTHRQSTACIDGTACALYYTQPGNVEERRWTRLWMRIGCGCHGLRVVWTVDDKSMTAPMNKLTRSLPCLIEDRIHGVIHATTEEPARMLNFLTAMGPLIAEDFLAEGNRFDAPMVVHLCHHHQAVDAPLITSGIAEKFGPDARHISRQAVIDDP